MRYDDIKCSESITGMKTSDLYVNGLKPDTDENEDDYCEKFSNMDESEEDLEEFSDIDESEDYPLDEPFDMNENDDDPWEITFNDGSEDDIFGSTPPDIWGNDTGFREGNMMFGNDDPFSSGFNFNGTVNMSGNNNSFSFGFDDFDKPYNDDDIKAKNTLDSRHKALICMTAVSVLLAVFFGIKAYKK